MRHKIDRKVRVFVARCTQLPKDAPGGAPFYVDPRTQKVLVNCAKCLELRRPEEPGPPADD